MKNFSTLLGRWVFGIVHKKVTSAQAFGILLGGAFLFVLPIILANVDYIDDNARRVSGYYDWGSLGRYVTEAIMHVLTFSGATLADPGRLMQVLSIPLLALCGWSVVRAIKGAKKAAIIDLSLGVVVVFNPFLIANLSFRYDCLSMVLAYYLAILAGIVAVKETRASLRTIVTATLLVLLSAACYQPMIMMTPVVVLILTFADCLRGDSSIFRRLLYGACAFLGGAATYFLSLKVFHFSNIGGASRGAVVSLNIDGVRMVIHNFNGGIETVLHLFKSASGKIIFVSAVLFGIVSCVIILRRMFAQKRWGGLCFVIIAPILLTLSIMGPFVLMDSALTYQVRTLSAAIGLMMFIAVIAVILVREKMVILGGVGLVIVGVFALYSLSISSSYGSVLSNQRQHDRMVYDEIDDYVLNNPQMKEATTVYIGGSPSMPISVESVIRKRPLLQRMDIAGDNTTWFLWMQLKDSKALKADIAWYTQSKEQEQMRRETCRISSGATYENPYFSVYITGKTAVIWQHDPLLSSNYCSTT